MNKNIISENLYKKIIHNVPLCCVDIIVKKGNLFLLVKRTEKPVKDKWWFPGGRVLFNESLKNTAKRKLKEELNIKNFEKMKFLGVKELKFRKGDFGKPVYSIVNVFLVEINEKQSNNIQVDDTASEYKWFSKIQKSFHPYLKRFLRLSGF